MEKQLFMISLPDLYRSAAFIRAFEEGIADAADKGHCPGLVHLCTGAEVAEAAICSFLDGARDHVTGSHRSHGLALALGVDPVAVAAEIFGRAGGLSGGRGGTQHLVAPEAGFLCSTGIVGAQVPIAAGAALSAKTLATGGIAATFFGDGAANQGAVLESLNLAVALKLPVLFVLENNGVGQTTASDYASGGVDLCARAAAFGLAVCKMNGLDPEACLKGMAEMVAHVRSTGPGLVEVSVPRLGGHYHARGAGKADCADPLDALAALVTDAPALMAEGREKARSAIAAALQSPEAA